jgi:hypothetical protein
LLLDPYSDPNNHLHIVKFESTNVFDNEFMRENDVIVKAIAQCSKSSDKDEEYKIYIWMQMYSGLIRSKMLNPNSYKIIEDSDNTDTEE